MPKIKSKSQRVLNLTNNDKKSRKKLKLSRYNQYLRLINEIQNKFIN